MAGWPCPALLDRLVSEKLQHEAEAIATEGWKWIEVSLDLPYGYGHGSRRLSEDPAPMIFDAEEIARAGAFVTLDRSGELAFYRGFLRSEDEPGADGKGAELSAATSTDGVGHATVITSAGQALGVNVPDDEDDGALRPLPERLVMQLASNCTLALREALRRWSDFALMLLLLKLVNAIFHASHSPGCCL